MGHPEKESGPSEQACPEAKRKHHSCRAPKWPVTTPATPTTQHQTLWCHLDPSASTSTHQRLLPGNSATLGQGQARVPESQQPCQEASTSDRWELVGFLPSGSHDSPAGLTFRWPWQQYTGDHGPPWLLSLSFYVIYLPCYLGSSTCS